MQELKSVGAFVLFAVLVLVVVNLSRVFAGAYRDHLPPPIVALMAIGPLPERPSLSEVDGAN